MRQEMELGLDDLGRVLEEILDICPQAYSLGLSLKVPKEELNQIQTTFNYPRDRLICVIQAFLKRIDPKPTWKVLSDALRSPLVNEHTLARQIEMKYCFHASQDTVHGKP